MCICVYVPLIYIHADGGVAIFYQRHTVVFVTHVGQ